MDDPSIGGSAADWPRYVNRRARLLMAVEGGVFVALGLLLSVGHQSPSQRAIALFILLVGVAGVGRSLFAYQVRLTPNEAILKSFYRTHHVSYSSMAKAKRTTGQVGLYQRAYLELARADGTSLPFKALNERADDSGEVASAVSAINYRIGIGDASG